MQHDFNLGYRAYRAGQALDLNKGRDWKAGWRHAELKYRDTPQAMPKKPPIPDTRGTS